MLSQMLPELLLPQLAAITWDIDPILIDFGPLQIRYYGILFAATIYLGFFLWRRDTMRNGYSPEYAERFLWYVVFGVVIGARLGHCLFYEPERYLSNPVEILYFWKGGLASHGATVGIFFVLWLFSKRNGVRFRFSADCMMPALALSVGGVRLGNFFNSEIVGRAWDGPWAVIFARYDRMMGIDPPIPRHPTAFYEVLMGLVTFAVLTWAIKKDWRRAGSGLLSGIFLILYFSFRFLVEFFKEYQVDQLAEKASTIARTGEGVQLTMGQYLSILPVLVGVVMLVMALREPKDAIAAPTPWQPGLGMDEIAAQKKGKARKKKK